MSKIYRVALVGCGVISKTHLTVLSELDRVRVVALCDIKAEAARGKASLFGLDCRIYTDYYEMLESEQLDAVHICTPHYLHAPMTLAALERGVHVFLEKPMCINSEEADAIIAAEKKSTASVCVCFQNRFSPSVVKAMEIAAADGGSTSGYASVFWDRDEKYYTESGWRGSYATEGGGVMINQAIHAIDLLCRFLGSPSSLRAKTENYHLRGVIEVEDSCDGIIYFDGGKTGNFYATTAAVGMASTVIYMVTAHHRIEVRNYRLFVDGEPVDTSEVESYLGKACYGNGHRPLISNFYTALELGEPMPVTPESARDAVDILLAAYRSDGETVKIK